MRNVADRSSLQCTIKGSAIQLVVRDLNVEQTEAGSKPGNGRQNIPAPDPAVNELLIRRVMAALMAEE